MELPALIVKKKNNSVSPIFFNVIQFYAESGTLRESLNKISAENFV